MNEGGGRQISAAPLFLFFKIMQKRKKNAQPKSSKLTSGASRTRQGAIPSGACWLVFDLDNGNPGSRQYVWWFETRQAAREHIAWQKAQEYSAELSRPMKFLPMNVELSQSDKNHNKARN